MEVKLYVANLAPTTTSDDLRTVFAQVGTVTSVNVVKDWASGLARGFAFVVMGSQSDAQKAISLLNGFMLQDHALKVTTAKEREAPRRFGDRGGAFGNGGGRPARSHGRRGGNRRY